MMGTTQCMNVAKKPSKVCPCIFKMRNVANIENSVMTDDEIYHKVCKEMSMWFNRFLELEGKLDVEELKLINLKKTFAECISVMPQNEGRAHTKLLNMTSQHGFFTRDNVAVEKSKHELVMIGM